MKRIAFILLIIGFASCNQKNNSDKIEIYLLNKKIRSVEGIPLKDASKFKYIDSLTLSTYESINYDTITNQFIYGGKFDAKLSDLEKEPLIEDSEILFLDIEKSELEFTNSAFQKFLNFKKTNNNHKQFAITVNKKPILTGYFRSKLTSYIFNYNYITFDESITENEKIENHPFKILYNDDFIKWKPKQINLNKYPDLINAFEKTNRIK